MTTNNVLTNSRQLLSLKHVDETWKEALLWEEQVYRALGRAVGFPTLRWSGVWADAYWIAMDYVGCNFERLHFFLGKEFTPRTVAYFAVQMVSRPLCRLYQA